jgi:signal transduction histidine kinase
MASATKFVPVGNPIMAFRPRLRTILLALNLSILLLPIGGIAILRLYENELVKQTETELIGQAALTAAAFREAYMASIEDAKTGGRQIDTALLGNPLVRKWLVENADGLTPLLPQLDLSHASILEPARPGQKTTLPPDPLAVAAGTTMIPILTTAKKITLSSMRIVDFQGIVVASSAEEMALSFMGRDEVVEALNGKPTSLLRYRYADMTEISRNSISRRTRYLVYVALPVIIENRVVGAVAISRTPLDVGKALYAIRLHLYKAGFVLVCVVLLMSLLATHYINRPVKALIKQAGLVKLGSNGKTRPIEKPVFEEAAQLSDAISQMANTLENRTTYIKNLATTISHEFKTPLTSLKGSIEILRDHYSEMDAAEREKFLAILNDETNRLSMMVRRLLELARAEVFMPGVEITHIDPLLKEAGAQFKARGLPVEIRREPAAGQVAMARENFILIIDNFLENALQHGGEGVQAVISVSESYKDGRKMVEIIVSDSGEGISPANAERVFRPFFTTARAKGGSGLGLAIVKSLIEAHDGTITLLPNTAGASFKICLPVDPARREMAQ